MFGFSVAGNWVIPIDSVSRSAGLAGVMTAQTRNHATVVRDRHRAGRSSRNTFIKCIQITQALETRPPGSYYPGTSEVGYATLAVVYSRERSSRLVVSGPGPATAPLRVGSRCRGECSPG